MEGMNNDRLEHTPEIEKLANTGQSKSFVSGVEFYLGRIQFKKREGFNEERVNTIDKALELSKSLIEVLYQPIEKSTPKKAKNRRIDEGRIINGVRYII